MKYKGISAYVISREKADPVKNLPPFADKEDMFRWGREAVDRYLEQQNVEKKRILSLSPNEKR